MKTILLVDDNLLILNMLKNQLEEVMLDIEILTAETYKEAIKYILNKDIMIHLAILDIHLPDAQDGELIEYATRKDIPTIAITGSIDDKTKDAIMKFDIVDYVTKNNIASIRHVTNSAKRILNNYDTNILIVDDSVLQLKIIYDILKKLKLNVTTAKDGEEAYDILNNSKTNFSLVLTDYNMPKMDGMELTLKIREKHHKGELGVIVISDSKEIDISTKFLKIGANDFINKPYSQAEVSIRINSNLDILELFTAERDRANKDYLTKAYNRRYFFEVGEDIFKKALKSKKDIAVAMIDIDKFKNINDTYGHNIGDIAIKEIVKVLNCNLREKDLMARFGGEEFCILFENIEFDELVKLLEKIRLAFENNIIIAGKHTIKYTVSIGAYYGLKDSLDDMINVSDEGLYYCKENGRNQVKIYY